MGLCNENDSTRHCFVGDLSLFSDNGGWEGDEINVKTEHSGVKVRFVDEAELAGKPGLLSRMLGIVF